MTIQNLARAGTATALAASFIFAGCGGGGGEEPAAAPVAVVSGNPEADTPDAPVDRGDVDTPVVDDGRARALAAGVSTRQLVGSFGPAFGWPVIPIHLALLPDGRVMSYGTDASGAQGAKLIYTLWEPTQGTAAGAFSTLPNTTGTDLFCNTQVLLPGSGDLLLLGGDRTDAWNRRNYATADVVRFQPASNTMVKQVVSMSARRWYASVVTTARGEQVVLGGRDDLGAPASGGAPATTETWAATPEVYSPTTGWRTLSTATSNTAYGGTNSSFYYPRAWHAPGGKVFVLGHAGDMYMLDPAGTGTLTTLAVRTTPSPYSLPAVMYAPGKILSLRANRQAVVVDLNGTAPKVTVTSQPSAIRQWGSATVLADGKVWVNGGSVTDNVQTDAVYASELWNPATGTWTTTAPAAKARLYHSTAMLLPDATVLTGGGGAPGPVKNLNAEIYTPPYLYRRDGSGKLAARPRIITQPTHLLGLGEVAALTTSLLTPASRVTLVRTGAASHSFNNEQRFAELSFTQAGPLVSVKLPTDRDVVPPGYYMLFVFNAEGVPSNAAIVKIG
jgi:hypothetical protein